MDAAIAGYLREGVEMANLTYREVAEKTGISLNRIGIILRQVPPPATIGEMGKIAAAIGMSASELLLRAESELANAELSNVDGHGQDVESRHQDDFDLVSHPHTKETGELMDE